MNVTNKLTFDYVLGILVRIVFFSNLFVLFLMEIAMKLGQHYFSLGFLLRLP